MKTLRKLSAAVILITAVFVMSADAGQTMTPCPPPEPGQTMTPCDPGPPLVPDDLGTSNAPNDIGTPTATNDETLFAKIAAEAFLYYLPLF